MLLLLLTNESWRWNEGLMKLALPRPFRCFSPSTSQIHRLSRSRECPRMFRLSFFPISASMRSRPLAKLRRFYSKHAEATRCGKGSLSTAGMYPITKKRITFKPIDRRMSILTICGSRTGTACIRPRASLLDVAAYGKPNAISKILFKVTRPSWPSVLTVEIGIACKEKTPMSPRRTGNRWHIRLYNYKGGFPLAVFPYQISVGMMSSTRSGHSKQLQRFNEKYCPLSSSQGPPTF